LLGLVDKENIDFGVIVMSTVMVLALLLGAMLYFQAGGTYRFGCGVM
jgi:hypothetical protein